VAGWVVGVDEDDGAGCSSDGAANAFRIDLPAVIVDQGGRFEGHIVENGEEVKKRIAGLDGEDFCAWIAEQAKEEAVGFAGAGGEDDLLGENGGAMVGIVAADSFPCVERAAGLGVVVERDPVGEGGEQVGRVGKAAAGWIGSGEIGNGQADSGAKPMGAGKRTFLGIPVGTLGESHEFYSRRNCRRDDGLPEMRKGAEARSGTIKERVLFHDTLDSTTHGSDGGRLGLRAVVFDYGMVLTGPQDPVAHAALQRITGLPLDRFEALYWVDRHAYDEGKLTGLEFWHKFLRDAGLELPAGTVEELNLWDARMWTTENPVMLNWQLELKRRGFLTAILSNMGDNVLDNMKREFAWLERFEVLVWSYQLRMAKPEPAIYLHVLKELGVGAEEALFLDDRQVNIDAARALGMQAIHFSSVDRLREDLVATGLSGELPLP